VPGAPRSALAERGRRRRAATAARDKLHDAMHGHRERGGGGSRTAAGGGGGGGALVLRSDDDDTSQALVAAAEAAAEAAEAAESAWSSSFLRGDTGSHTIVLPAAVAAAFRVRAHCADGSVTLFSEEQRVEVGLPKGTGAGLAIAVDSAVLKVLVVVHAHVEAVTFLFSDGSRRCFASLAHDAAKRARAAAAVAAGYNGGDSADEEDTGALGACGGVLALAAGEALTEVKGVNSGHFCEAIEFVTSHGRRVRCVGRERGRERVRDGVLQPVRSFLYLPSPRICACFLTPHCSSIRVQI